MQYLRRILISFIVVGFITSCTSDVFDPKKMQIRDLSISDDESFSEFRNSIDFTPAEDPPFLVTGGIETIQPYFSQALALSLSNNHLKAPPNGSAKYRLTAELKALEPDASRGSQFQLTPGYAAKAVVHYRLIDLNTGKAMEIQMETGCEARGALITTGTAAFEVANRCAISSNIDKYIRSIPSQIF